MRIGFGDSFGLGLAAGVAGWRPGRRLAGWLLAAPVASVSTLAWNSGNPFNGAVFGILAVLMAVLATRSSPSPVRVAGGSMALPGAALLIFGWAYPHFLQTGSTAEYLYAAPLGLLPCPTLSAVAGIALMLGGLGSRGWAATLAAAGILYGLLGWLRLGVWIEIALLAGTLLLGLGALAGAVRTEARRSEA